MTLEIEYLPTADLRAYRANGDQIDVEQALAVNPLLFLRLRPAGSKR